MDFIHDATNTFKFKLTTLVVVDDDGEGFPVAFCISSKADALAMEVFLEHVRTAVGKSVLGAILITDCEPACVDAWRTVMGPPDRHFLCAWDIDMNWRKNVLKMKCSTEVKAQVHKTIRVALETDKKQKFHDLLKSTLDNMEAEEGTREFLSYFRREFVSRPEVWANSYRLGLQSHHNVNLESFHQTLKHVFTQGIKVFNDEVMVYLNVHVIPLELLYWLCFLKYIEGADHDVNF